MVPDLLLKHHQRLEEKMEIHNQEELMYQQSFFAAGSIALLVRWLKGGCVESPEEMSELMRINFVRFFHM